MIRPWKPEPGDRGPHRDVILKPFQTLLGSRLEGRVTVDASRLYPEDYTNLRRWVCERVECRLMRGATVTVLYD